MDHVATIVTTMPILVVVVDRIINKSPGSVPKWSAASEPSLDSFRILFLGWKTSEKVSLK
ncbi:MAG: hypothetical protein VX396_01685 [SAR324 cluster bacterium]|nr:hypothetical protein [SAR324 cluster bacterium]